MRIELENDTVIETATQSDIDYVVENYREEDRKENDVFSKDHDSVEMFEQCWSISHKGKLIGYCGIMVLPGETILSPRRFICFMTCENANRIKVTFVRMSRAVMRAIVSETHGWVDTFFSAPVEQYHGSIIWHERVLKMHRFAESIFNNHMVIHFFIERKEVLS